MHLHLILLIYHYNPLILALTSLLGLPILSFFMESGRKAHAQTAAWKARL
jgi:hypothetical protein